MTTGTLVYLTDKIDMDGVRPPRIAEVVGALEDDGLIVQPLDPLTCEPVGSEEEISDTGCRPIISPSGTFATKAEWLAEPWPATD